MGKVTLKEIAREAGLSVATVSLVLNNRPCRVSDENRRLIKRIAAEKHYVPNQIARSLVTQRSGTLGLIVPNIESRFFARLARNLELRSRKRGYALFITTSDGSTENDSDLLRLLVNRGVEGLFMVASSDLSAGSLPEEVGSLPVPCVMVDRVFDEVACDKALFDHRLGGYLATKHLLEQGHRRIACLVNAEHAMTGRLRLQGYGEALAEYGLSVDPAYVFETDYYSPDAYEAARGILDTDATAVFASSDNIALGLLKRLYEAEKRVPRDYSVVSYDNSAADSLFEPALTAVDQDVSALADAAFALLARRLDGYEGEAEVRMLKPQLVVKDSVRAL